MKIYIIIIILCIILSAGISYVVNKSGDTIDKAEKLRLLSEEVTDEESETFKKMTRGRSINTDIISDQQKKEIKKELDNMDDDKLEELKQKYKEKLSEEEREKLKQINEILDHK